MLSLFRTNQLFANLLLIAYVALVRSSIFVMPISSVFKPQGILSYELAQMTSNQPWIEPFLAMLLVLIQAIMINVLVTRYRMSDEQSLFPGLFYTLIVSSIPDFLGLSSTLLATTFIIVSLYDSFVAYRKPEAAGNIFNIGLWIAVGSFFHFSLAIYVVWAIIAISVLRTGSLKEILMILCGIFTAYFLIGTVYFVTNRYDYFWQHHIKENIAYLNLVGGNNWLIFGERIFFFILIGITVLFQGFYASKKSIQVQKYQTVLYWSMILAGTTLIFQAKADMSSLILVAPALCIFLSYHFLNMRNSTSEAIHFLWLAAVLFLQYQGFLL
jgi:hypothetical protein